MEALLNFAKGPLFRLSFAIMVLGLLRLLILTVYNLIRAHMKAGDKTLPYKYIINRTIGWMFPIKRIIVTRPLYSIVSVLFHIGLIITPIFLYAHINLWTESLGISWPALGRTMADILTIITVFAAIILFIGRLSYKGSSFLSRPQDYWWPLLLAVPFITGYIAVNWSHLAPRAYQIVMLFHFISADLIFLLIPFTKAAHCVLMPFSQFVSAQAWRFPDSFGDEVAETLNRKELPI